MTRAKRILLIASMLVVSLDTANAGLFRRNKAAKPADPAPAAAGMALTAVDVDGSRVLLRTSGTPAYTSYSPSPDVFVVDLTATSRGADVVIPSTLPASVATISAEEAVEMGNRLTRVTFRLRQPAVLSASASDNSVVVMTPEGAIAETALPQVTPIATPEPAPVQIAEAPHVEVVNEPVQPMVAEPSATMEPLPATKATTLKKVETTGTGSALEVRISGNGAIDYKAFRLENPSRLVIDLNGLKNAATKNNITVDDSIVKRIRVAQFKGAPDPVTRVVMDLGEKTTYRVTQDGERLRVTFGGHAPAAIAEVAPKTEAPKPVPIASAPAASSVTVTETAASVADIPAVVPAVAENSTWKMPPAPPSRASAAPKGARGVINAPADQNPPDTQRRTQSSQPRTVPTTVPTSENVFNDPAAQQPAPSTSSQGTVLSGTPTSPSGRTLSSSQRVYTGEPISLNLKDADIKDVLRTFAQLTGLNIAVDPGVGGTVTVDFVDVPWDQALDLILRQNGLTFVLEGNVMRVGTIARLTTEARATQELAEQERLNVQTQTVSFKLSYARAGEVQTLLREIASPRARIIVDTRTNQLIISEIPQYLQTMRNLIDTIDIPTRQVVIEARIVETTKNFQQQFGFNWGFSGAFDPALGTGTGLVFPNRVDFIGGPFNFGPGRSVIRTTLTDVLGFFSLDLALTASEFEGLVKVISAPKVTTQDNTPAEIQSGFQIPYQTRVNFTTTVTYVDATLRLSVTPQITEAGTVIMDIALQKTEPATGLTVEGAAGTPLTTRQARTRLMVRDGGTAVIGGIYTANYNTGQTRLPLLHQIPILGALFREHDITTSHDELLIFITPRIVRGS